LSFHVFACVIMPEQAICSSANSKAERCRRAEIAQQPGKIIPPPRTVKALQTYLELPPNGPYAPQGRHFLIVLNSNVETSYGTNEGTSEKQ
jgi:hypothetical protein